MITFDIFDPPYWAQQVDMEYPDISLPVPYNAGTKGGVQGLQGEGAGQGRTHQLRVRSGGQICQQREMEFLVSKELVREAEQNSDEV